MSSKRVLLLVVGLVLAASLLAGCSSEKQDATFVGYRQRPTDTVEGVAIVQLSSGEPAQASCDSNEFENGDPVQVQKSGDSYEIVSGE